MHVSGIDPGRRALLTALAGLGIPGFGRTSSSEAAQRVRGDPFTLGVASGSPSANGFVVWTRLAGSALDPEAAVPVRWEVFEEDSRRTVVAAGQATALPAFAHAVHVEVGGLRPDRWYGYRFMAGDAVSPAGRTRTLPAPDAVVQRLRFAYASCQNWEAGYYAGYRHMLAERPDLVLFLGDYIYESASRPEGAARAHGLPVIRTLEDYRTRYALHRSDPDLQRMHAACPWLVIWDDHEVENNYGALQSSKDTPAFPELRAAAYQAFYEHMPLRASALVSGLAGLGSGGELRIHGHADVGRLARFHLMDDRQYRDAPLCRERQTPAYARICTSPAIDQRSLLGADQERWLAGSMEAAARRGTAWNFLVQQTVFTPRNHAHGEGRRFSVDAWDGYPAARRRLLADLADRRPRNPVFIGGDIHQNWVANVHARPYDAGSPVVGSEFCGTSITSRSGASAAATAQSVRDNPHCLLNDAEHRGYGLVDLRPDRASVRLRVLDDVTDPASGVRTLAAFAVENGRPGVLRGG